MASSIGTLLRALESQVKKFDLGLKEQRMSKKQLHSNMIWAGNTLTSR